MLLVLLSAIAIVFAGLMELHCGSRCGLAQAFAKSTSKRSTQCQIREEGSRVRNSNKTGNAGQEAVMPTRETSAQCLQGASSSDAGTTSPSLSATGDKGSLSSPRRLEIQVATHRNHSPSMARLSIRPSQQQRPQSPSMPRGIGRALGAAGNSPSMSQSKLMVDRRWSVDVESLSRDSTDEGLQRDSEWRKLSVTKSSIEDWDHDGTTHRAPKLVRKRSSLYDRAFQATEKSWPGRSARQQPRSSAGQITKTPRNSVNDDDSRETGWLAKYSPGSSIGTIVDAAETATAARSTCVLPFPQLYPSPESGVERAFAAADCMNLKTCHVGTPVPMDLRRVRSNMFLPRRSTHEGMSAFPAGKQTTGDRTTTNGEDDFEPCNPGTEQKIIMASGHDLGPAQGKVCSIVDQLVHDQAVTMTPVCRTDCKGCDIEMWGNTQDVSRQRAGSLGRECLVQLMLLQDARDVGRDAVPTEGGTPAVIREIPAAAQAPCEEAMEYMSSAKLKGTVCNPLKSRPKTPPSTRRRRRKTPQVLTAQEIIHV